MSDDVDGRMSEATAVAVLMTRLQQERAFPPESLAPQIGFPDGRFVDLAVFNDRTGTLLAVFELKLAKPDQTRATVALRQSLESLAPYARGAQLYGVLAFDDGTYQLYRYAGEHALEPIGFDDIPSHPALTGAVVVRKSAAVEKSKRSVRLTIAVKSYLFSGTAALLFVGGLCGWWDPTWELLALLGSAFVLALLPDLSHFKLLGLEIGLLSSEIDSSTGKAGHAD